LISRICISASDDVEDKIMSCIGIVSFSKAQFWLCLLFWPMIV